MRVLMTGDTIGGVWTYCLALADGLGRLGIEVHLATMGRLPSAGQRAAAGAVRGLVLHASEAPLCWMPEATPGELRRAGHWLLELVRRSRPDLVHLNDFGHGGLPWPVPVVLVGHSCVLSWWQAVHGVSAPAQWNGYRALVQRALERADCVVAPTRAMGRALRQHYGLRIPARVVPNGLASPRDGGPAPKQPLILAAGRLWDQAKNIAALADVAASLRWPVAVAGEGGADASRWHALRLLGPLPPAALAAHYRAAAVFALPARYEPFGLAPLEAASRGCALVLGDIPSLREVWGDAALFVPPDDRARLGRTLSALIDDPDLRHRYARRASARAADYGIEQMTEGYVRVYDRVLDRVGAQVSAAVAG